MNITGELITDRTTKDINRLSELSAKGWAQMNETERREWMFGNDTIDWADGECIVCLDGDLLIDGESNKGAYNAVDLNRVGEAMLYIKSRYDVFGYAAPISPKTDWAIEDIPTTAQMKQYLDDVAALRKAMELPPATPNVPLDMDVLTVEEANDIERILQIVDYSINQTIKSFRRSGQFTFWSGTLPLPV